MTKDLSRNLVDSSSDVLGDAKRGIAVLLLTMSVSGCVTPTTYSGTVLNCNDEPVSDVKVTTFKNAWMPLTLSGLLGSARSAEDGTFNIQSSDRANFITVVAPRQVVKVVIEGSDRLSVNYCGDESATLKHQQ